MRKDPAFYRPLFGDVPDDLPYHWPDADELPTLPDEDGQPLWIARASGPDVAQAFLTGGFVALAQPPGRSAKGRRQIDAFAGVVEVGDLVGLPLDGGAALAVGEIVGPHRVESGDEDLPHRRAVRWLGEVPRSAVRAPAQLQDPRSLFRVRLAAEVPGGVPRRVSGGTAAAPARRGG